MSDKWRIGKKKPTNQAGKKQKMPRRPMYGELDPGETYPPQGKKVAKPKAPRASATPIRKVGTGMAGEVKKAETAIKTRKQRMEEELGFMNEGATTGRAAKHEKDMYGK